MSHAQKITWNTTFPQKKKQKRSSSVASKGSERVRGQIKTHQRNGSDSSGCMGKASDMCIPRGHRALKTAPGGCPGVRPLPPSQVRKGDKRGGVPDSHLTETNSLEHQIPKGKQSAWTDSQGERPLTSSQPSFCNKCPWRLIKKESHTLSFIWKTIATIYAHLLHMWWKGKRCIEMSWRREVIENKVFLHLSVYSSHIYGPPTMCQALGQMPKTLYWPQTHLVYDLLKLMIQEGKHQQVK